MILNDYEEMEQLRKEIEEKVKKVKDGERIHIDKKILELLLFEKIDLEINVLKNMPFIEEKKLEQVGQKPHAKIIVWSGDFLSKIDLSEVSFDDVVWNVQSFLEDADYAIEKSIKSENAEKATQYSTKDYTELEEMYGRFYRINLSNTNAKIDFSKSFEGKLCMGTVRIAHCNFENVDLSNNTIYDPIIEHSNLKNTKIVIKKSPTSDPYDQIIYCSNMSGTDCSEYTVFGEFFLDTHKDSIFTNSGLRIVIDKDWEDEDITNERVTNYIAQEIKNGHLEGCYVNDVLIKSQEQRLEDAKRLKEELEQGKYDIDSIMSDIDDQIKGMKK